MIYEVELYQKENGRIPIEEFLLSLLTKLRAKAFSDIELLQKHGNDLREPYVKPVKGKYNNKFVLLHGFIKKNYEDTC